MNGGNNGRVQDSESSHYLGLVVVGKLEKVMFFGLSRSNADERCFWRRKTELSLSIIEKLEPHQFVLWLRANEWEAFEDNF